MTEAQITAIKEMTLNPQDLRALMEKLGIEMPKGDGNAPNPGNLSDEELATRRAERESLGQGGQGGGPGGGPPGGVGGMMPPGGGMPGGGQMPEGGQMPGGGQMPNAQGIPQPGMGRPMGGGMNNMVLEPLIKLLEERAGSN